MASLPRLGALALLMQQTREPPRFADARVAIRQAFAEVQFPEKITPIEAANRHRHLRNPGAYSGPWRDSPEPMQHLVEPTNNLAMASRYSIIAVIGPSQMGKSEVGNNWQVHSVIYDPADMAFFSPTKELTASYVTTQINKLLEECPDVAARQLGTASADNIYLKQFRGCDWHFLWPTGPNFRARPFSRGRFDDLDDFPDDIGDQGDAVSLFEGRTTSFQGYGFKIYVNSSPKKGPKRGIEPLVASGTSKRWWVDCQHKECGEPFEMAWERLSFERGGTALQAAETAEMSCPTCGGVHKQADKPALMATGRWVGKGEEAVSWSTGSTTGKIGDLEPNSIDSYWWDGTFGLAPWASLARQYRTAEPAGVRHHVDQLIAGQQHRDRAGPVSIRHGQTVGGAVPALSTRTTRWGLLTTVWPEPAPAALGPGWRQPAEEERNMGVQDDDAIYEEGHRAGRDGNRLAVDCPYLPGVDLTKRQRWLKGFSDGRLDTPPLPDDSLPTPVPTPHAG